ncbi:protease modulator HflC [Salmonella enterica]|nr:protease modulator HflC [Salmonella enterica]EBW0192319.1 protease modulator HflC [Salmonella enterica subsp. enterica serovar Norwich]EBW0200401.1 protease modulator HflC [Salmonella enterica subsp. enterica serovar Senftenberg]EDW8245915.1 protease modulator HflC [Salmonella enterica subsp. enterica serovar Javiana]EEE0783182.1 protease modulator HflC [Salmonella enterica subsp. enterica serovar 6,7:-:-]
MLTACLVQVQSGNATVITRFGSPVRVLLEPGLAWRLPAPFESPVDVNLRTRSTSSGLQDVGTRDGLRVIVQAWAIWKVNPEPEHVLRFIRAVQNQPEEAARQIRTFIGSSLETTTSNYALSDIVNTDGKKIKISQLEKQIENQLKTQLLNSYGIELVQVGIERLTLPSVTLNATVERMRAERETIATERTAEGNRLAAEIHSKADRDARIMEADASVKASAITAQAQRDVAAIYAKAYTLDPQLYNLLRSLDTLNDVVNKSTRIVLSTDADPFKALVQQPSETDRPSQ